MTDETKEPNDLMVLGSVEPVAERPKSLDPNDLSGTEDIGANDVRLPRLGIAQGLSPQMTPGEGQYIEGLKLFDMFNDLTGEIYGKGPITFVPLRRDVRRIEFTPRSEGGGIVDLEVPKNDTRMKWTVVNGVRTPPVATEFVEFVILLLRPGKVPEPIVLSIKGTNKWNRRASDQLTTFIKLRNAPIYSGLYKVDTLTPAKNDSGTFGVPVCKNAGFIPMDTPAGKSLYNYAKQFADSLAGKVIVVDREPGSTDDFDVEAMEREGAGAAAGGPEM
jgi:hypothetical protein